MGRKKFKQYQGSNEGQALIEFVLGLMIVISFFFFYVKMAALFAIGNYIHYATFMASRAYSSSAQSENAQKANAESVLAKMVEGRWKAIVKASDPGIYVGPGAYYQEDSRADNWNTGASYSFEGKLSLYPWSRNKESIKVKLTSESWMRREESVEECESKRVQIDRGLGINGLVTEWDNGC